MGLWQRIVMAFLTGCICLPVVAQQVDNVTFNNHGGMLRGTSINSGQLSLNNSTLIQVSGFTGALSGFDTTGANLGTLIFTTGSLTSGTMAPTSAQPQPSTFGPGGSFTVTDTLNGGFTFTGTFTSASWQCVPGISCTHPTSNTWHGAWQFSGVLTNVVLTSNGQQIPINGAITFQATTLNGTASRPNANGPISFQGAGGLTNFNLTVMPEPGTLVLFGSGLIGVGTLVKFRQQRKRER